MRSFSEREGFLETVRKLFPEGGTKNRAMMVAFQGEGIRDIALTRVSILTRKTGKNNFVVAYLATPYLNNQGEIIEDPFSGNSILEHPAMLHVQKYCGVVDQLGRLDLHNYPNARLIPDKISPLDVPRLAVVHFRARHFLVSTQTVTLAQAGVDVILPKGQTDFEIRSLQELVEDLQTQLFSRRWHGVHLNC